MLHRLNVCLGILLLSAATLSLEIILTRLFAIALWHYLAYLVISIALFGFGASGIYLSIDTRLQRRDLRWTLTIGSILFAVATLFGTAVLVRVPVNILQLDSVRTHLSILLYDLVLALPFFFSGGCLALALTKMPANVGAIYAVNMVGSGLGCVAVVPLLWYMGVPGALVFFAAVGAMAALCFAPTKILKGLSVLLIGLLCLCVFPLRNHLLPVRPAPSKLLALAYDMGKESEYHQWTPIGRVDVVDLENRKVVLLDGDAATFMYPYDGTKESIREIAEGLEGGAYRICRNPDVLIIGAGGGPDILIALHNDAKRITAVEINPATIRVLTEVYRDYLHNIISTDPRIHVEQAEGRSYVRRLDRQFDLIQMTGVDTYTALASGAYILSESYLYTVEAFRDYLSHLRETGILAVVRLSFDPPRENLKLIVTSVHAMQEMDIRRPERNVLLVRANKFPYIALSLFKKIPFTDIEIETFKQWCQDDPRFSLVYAPGIDLPSYYQDYFSALARGVEKRFLDEYAYNVRPAKDDSPFFYSQYKWSNVFSSLPVSQRPLEEESKTAPGFTWLFDSSAFRERPLGMWLLAAMLAQMILLAIAFVLVPLFIFKREGIRVENASSFLTYFGCLGIGYMFIEISSIQRLILFLGHPTYSITTVLFTFLTFSGLGSAVTGRLGVKGLVKDIRWVVVCIVVIGVMMLAVSDWLVDAALDSPFWVRIGATVMLLAPLAFCMGMPFPLGIRFVERATKDRSIMVIPWVWAVNAALSVVGSILSVTVAMVWGFRWVTIIALAVYVLGAWRLGVRKDNDW